MIPPHLVLIEPIQDDESYGREINIPDQAREAFVQCGWVTDLGVCEEQIKPGDLVTFVGWKQKNVTQSQYAHWRHDKYVLHEDDIELVIEEW